MLWIIHQTSTAYGSCRPTKLEWRDIIDNDNANYRALHDEMVKMQMDAKDQTIASQQAAINKLELTASQCAQNQYLVNQLRPAAVPAFTVPNPYANYGFGCYC